MEKQYVAICDRTLITAGDLSFKEKLDIARGLDKIGVDAIEIGELSEKMGITMANLSILKTGKAKAIKFSTLAKLCKILNCQPADLLEYREE